MKKTGAWPEKVSLQLFKPESTSQAPNSYQLEMNCQSYTAPKEAMLPNATSDTVLDDCGQGETTQRAKPRPRGTVHWEVIYRGPNQRQPGLTTTFSTVSTGSVFSLCLEGFGHFCGTVIPILSIPLPPSGTLHRSYPVLALLTVCWLSQSPTSWGITSRFIGKGWAVQISWTFNLGAAVCHPWGRHLFHLGRSVGIWGSDCHGSCHLPTKIFFLHSYRIVVTMWSWSPPCTLTWVRNKLLFCLSHCNLESCCENSLNPPMQLCWISCYLHLTQHLLHMLS